jgi:hypothetical protein
MIIGTEGTAFVEDPGLWKAIKTSTFDMNQLVLTNKRVHVVIPFDYTEQMSSWLRLTIAAFYNACLRNQLPSSLPPYLRFRHIIIDEFAGLGKLDFIMKGIAEARGAGIKYHLVIQNFPQLHNLYKDGWENLVSNSLIHAFGVNENFTAEYLSKMTGQSTVITESKSYSESTTTGTSHTSGSSSPGGGSSSSSSTSTSRTFGSSTTFASTGRPVLTPDEIRRISSHQQLLFLRGMPVLMSRRTPYFETFKKFLPQHTLKQILSSTRLLASAPALVPYSLSDLNRHSRLIEVNSTPRVSSFRAPIYKPYTLGEALRQSPGYVAAGLAAVCVAAWLTFSTVGNAIQQSALDAQARAERERAAAAAAETMRLDAINRAQLEQQARVIDDRIRGPYTALAGDIFNAISSAGMCSSQTDVASGLSCSEQATYDHGQIQPFNLSFSVQRKQFVTLSVTPNNEKRNDPFNGAAASLTVKSVFEKIDMASADDSRFHPALRPVLASMFRAFGLPPDLLTTCQNSDDGVARTLNSTSVQCHFEARPGTIGGLSEFTLNLRRPM